MQVFRAQSGIMVRSGALWARNLGFNPDSTLLLVLSSSHFLLTISLSHFLCLSSLGIPTLQTAGSNLVVPTPLFFHTVSIENRISVASVPDTRWAFNKQSQLLWIHQKWFYRLALKHIRYCFTIQTYSKKIIIRETTVCAVQNLQFCATSWFRIPRFHTYFMSNVNLLQVFYQFNYQLFTNANMHSREIILTRIQLWL